MDPITNITASDLGGENKAAAAPALQDRGGYTIEYKHFAASTPAEGFGYNTIQYTSVDTAREKLKDEAILALINSAITSSLRVKAKSKLPENENLEERATATKNLLESTKGVLLTEDEAIAFVPGVREKTSPTTLMRLGKEANEAGNKELAKSYFRQAKEALDAQILAAVGSLESEES